MAQFLEARVSTTEEGELYVDITELRMDQIYITYYHNWLRFLFCPTMIS